MEAVGLGVGVVGLAGLFSACLDVVSRYDSFKEFETESQSVKAQFNAHKLRLQNWGHAVGLQGDRLMEKHSELLDDQKVHSACSDMLSSIQAICSHDDDSKISLFSDISHHQSLRNRPWSKGYRDGQASRRERWKWALRDKQRKSHQVSHFCNMVDALHHLVPIDGRGATSQTKPGEAGQVIVASDFMNLGRRMTEFEQLMRGIERDIEDEIKRMLHIWLLGSDFHNELFEISVAKRVPGTCEWALQREWFLDWLSNEFPGKRAKILWINGPAGFGKSILCAKIAEHLLKDSKILVAHFFYSSGFDSGRNPFAAMRSWISQIMSHNTVFDLTRERESANQGRNPTRQDIANLFRDIVTAIPGCTFIIDGLDECSSVGDDQKFDDGHSISNFLKTLKSTVTGTQTRILIVSRDEPEIRNTLCNDEGDASMVYRHNLRPDDVRSDTEIYSRSIVHCKLSTRPGDFKEEIALKLAARCNGQFLWAKLHEDYLRKGKSNAQIRNYINSTPSGLEHAYERNWESISLKSDEDQDRAISILRWAAFSLRPLTVSEITGALLINEDCNQIRVDELPDNINEEYMTTEILDLCGSLIEIRIPQGECDVGLRTVHLTHFSVRENLLSVLPSHKKTLQLYSGLAVSTEAIESTLLAKMCLSYVDCEEVWVENFDEQEGSNVLHAFRNYATVEWSEHTRLGNNEDEHLIDLAKHFFIAENPNWTSWKKIIHEKRIIDIAKYLEECDSRTIANLDPDSPEDVANEPSTKSTKSSTVAERIAGKPAECPLWYAADIGLTSIVDSLITANQDRVNEQGAKQLTPLGAACQRGNLDTARILLDNHAEVDNPDGRGLVPLHLASIRGHHDVVKLLLTKGANVEAQNKELMTSIHFAATQGHLKTTQLLLDHNADIEARTSDGFTALHGAIDRGHTELVKMLIAKGANITPAINVEVFNTACRNGFLEIVQILFDLGVEIDGSTSENQFTPLIWASYHGHFEIAKFLIENGANIEARSKNMETPLYCAATEGHFRTVHLLLNYNADVNVRQSSDWTPVHSAVQKGHNEIVKILVSKGANIGTANSHGMIPFHTACLEGHNEIARLLFDVGVDINVKTQENRYTPLIVASTYGHLEIVEFLIEKGANIESRTKKMVTALHFAVFDGHVEVVKMLVAKGADTKAANSSGMVPFFTACLQGHSEVARLLFDFGVDVNINTQENRYTPLIVASECGHIEVVKFLLENGANVEARNSQMMTPLYGAVLNGHTQIIQLLLDHDADVNVRNVDDWTLLHAASRHGHVEIVEILLEKGAEIDTPNKGRETPLDLATFGGHLEVIKILVDNGADVTTLNTWGFSLLNTAADRGHLQIVKMLLDNGAEVESKNNNGMTPLGSASENGFTEVVKFLIEKGADYTSRNNKSCTPIMSACAKGHIDVVKLLLNQNPRPSLTEQDSDGRTPLNLAVIANRLDIVKMLFEKGADITLETPENGFAANQHSTPVYNASVSGNVDIMKLILDKGANLNVQGHNGFTPINSACINGHLEVVKLLVTYGADLHIVNASGWSPLFAASLNGFTEIVRLLLGAGAEVNHFSETKSTPLAAACLNGHLEVAKLLVTYGADLHIVSTSGESPLLIASCDGFTEIVRLLLEEGAEVNHVSEAKLAPLAAACCNGHLEVVSLLVRYGADPNFAPNPYESPLYLASWNGFSEMVRLLLGDTFVDRIKKTNRTPLHVAIRECPNLKRTPLGKLDVMNPTNENGRAHLAAIVEKGSVLPADSTLGYASPNLEALDKYGRTPLFISAIKGHTDIVKLLHAKGAAVNIHDKYGATPLEVAVKNGQREVVEYLISIPGTLHSLGHDLWGRGLLWWALGCGSDDTLKLVRGVVETAEVSETETQERCKVTKYDVNLCWCPVCTRRLLDDEPYQCCSQCDDFNVCSQCVSFGAQCNDSLHTWEQKVTGPKAEDSKDEDKKEI